MLIIFLLIVLLFFLFKEEILCLFETPEETYERHVRKYHSEYAKCFTTVRSHSRKNGQNVRSHTRQIKSLPIYPKKPLALIRKEQALALELKAKVKEKSEDKELNANIINIEKHQPLIGLKARFFFAPQVYRTWPKLAVLTSDGVLYSEFKVNSSGCSWAGNFTYYYC